jgi:hypothetical protein
MPDSSVTLKAKNEADRNKVLEALRGIDFSDGTLEEGGEGEAFAVLRFPRLAPDDAMNRAGELVREAARTAGVPDDNVGAEAEGYP